MPIKALAFDLYGTILDTNSIAPHLPVPEEHRAAVAAAWRKHQLEYTWRLTIMGQYLPFEDITRRALRNAVHECGLPELGSTRDVLDQYRRLEAFADACPAITELNTQGNVDVYVFSNGHESVVAAALNHVGLTGVEVVSVNTMRTYKPALEVYRGLCMALGLDPQEVALVSGNAFDIVGADAVGIQTVWVDREGRGWKDGLGYPAHTVTGLGELKELVAHMNRDR
ncbi:haloacid dehalogenase [Geopyxis carbonaria]|nr:haloacid dehalogenase [Geopyxis carbonaria]